MPTRPHLYAVDAIRAAATPLSVEAPDYTSLLDLIGGARFVLLGEASHGTHEFYSARAHITRQLIAEKGFTAVAVEADWPDAYRVNRYVRLAGGDPDAEQALSGFKRFPTWMWRNADVLDFVGWLRAYNEERPLGSRAGFYGLDLYSLFTSMNAVVEYLAKIDPEAARRARRRYACFDHFGENTEAYGYAATLGLSESCESEVVGQLLELQRRAAELARLDGRVAEDDFFYAEQNARLAKNAEQYYRAMFRSAVASWNLRDRHMAETLDALVKHLERNTRRARLVEWAHNSHLGDARATEMGQRGELNVGQLVRERYGSEAVLVGFTTHAGTVTAATDWHGPPERKQVRPALPGSVEQLLHETGMPRLLLPLERGTGAFTALSEPRLERAIGVIYRPETEGASHYFHARVADQFDAVLHFDHTRAVEPLERHPLWEAGEIPETFPTGM